jgi:hypothetical protein
MKQQRKGTSMRLKSLIAAVALGVGLAGTGLAAAEATTATPKPKLKPTSSPGHLRPRHAGDQLSRPRDLPHAPRPGRAIPKTPNYTG